MVNEFLLEAETTKLLFHRNSKSLSTLQQMNNDGKVNNKIEIKGFNFIVLEDKSQNISTK